MEEFKNANYYWIGLSVVLAFISHFSRAVRWRLLIEPMGYTVTTANLFYAVMVGYLGNLALPRLGEILRPGIIDRYEKVPIQKLLGTIIIERAIDFLLLGCIMMFTIIFQFSILKDLLQNTILVRLSEIYASSGMGSLTTMLIIAGVLAGIGVLGYVLFRQFRGSKFALKLRAFLKGLWEGVITIKNLQQRGLFIFHTLLIWACYYLMSYVCVFSMESTSHLGIMAGFSILSMGSLGIVAPVQGGMGAYHWIMFQTLLLYNVPETQGKAFAAIVHSSQMLFILVVGFLSLLLLPIYNNRRKAREKAGQHEEGK